MAKSLFDQLTQVRGTRIFFDDMKYVYAEQVGRHYTTSTVATVSGSDIIVDGSTTFVGSEKNNFIVIDEGNGAGVYQITTVSGLNATVTPVPIGTDAAASARRHYYQNLEDDLNYLRKMMQLVIGEDEWNDEPDTDLKNMAYLIPKRPNYVGETTQYTDRPGTVGWAIDDIDQTGFVSKNNPAGYYSDAGGSSTTSGTNIRFTDDSTIQINITGGFYPADSGYLRLYKDGQIIGELNLATAWTSDGCSYETAESDVGTNPNHTAGGGADIFNLTGRRCMNTSVDSYPSFWPPYQIASVTATYTLEEGYNGQLYLVHSVGGGNQNYVYAQFWVDTTAQSISAGIPTVVQLVSSTKHLSGVPYYNSGATFTISDTNSDTLFDEGYPANAMRFNCSEFNDSSKTPSYAQIGLSTPVGVADTINSVGGYSTTITVGAGNFRNMDARTTATFWNVFTSSTSAVSAAGTFRIDTYGTTSTNTIEYFDDENKRFLGDENFNNTGITWTDSNWNSNTNITTISGLVFYGGTCKYPDIDHSSGFLPVGPDYSSASGDFILYRVFVGSGAFTQGSITFGGWGDALSTIQGGNVEAYLRMPNCSDYGNGNNGDVWQDLGIAQTTYGGDGCLGSGSSGSTVAFSFGTTSSSPFGDRIILKLIFKASSVNDITQITFTPTV